LLETYVAVSVRHQAAEVQKMPTQQTNDIDGFKARAKATWMAGNYARIAETTAPAATEFIARLHLKPGVRLLDVACGSGNLCIPAAKADAAVTGVDIAPNLLDEARSRAAQESVDIAFDEGDAEQLPYQDGAFDIVVSMFGAMFAPRPEVVARELSRVCRPGGQIVMANWTPTGFIGDLFRLTGKHVAPPAGVPSPLQWGDEATVRERLAGHVADIRCTRHIATLVFPFSVADTIEFYRVNYGPTLRAFAALSDDNQAMLRRDLQRLYDQHNVATDRTTNIAAEYLEVVATRS
jgi:2-polyprenyl-3-methyl-5-hydroxy-6-metoxy-1,4-benzoquinol methylase